MQKIWLEVWLHKLPVLFDINKYHNILGICLICVFWKYINILHISVIKVIFWDTINPCKKVKNSLTTLYKCVIYKWQD